MTKPDHPQLQEEIEIIRKHSQPQPSIKHSMTIFQRSYLMGVTFEIPLKHTPTDIGNQRLRAFHTVISDEVQELLQAQAKYEDDPVDLVSLADCLGDIVVYCLSEANRWGIPLEDVLHTIYDSQNSKLVNGKPVWADDHSKFIKGPNYVPPEPRIHKLLYPPTTTSE